MLNKRLIMELRYLKLFITKGHQRKEFFSRLLAITMQRPTVIGLQATQNHCTIAHITVLLVALTVH